MIIDPIAITLENLKNMEATKEAAFRRLRNAGIVDEDGKLAKIYRSSPRQEK